MSKKNNVNPDYYKTAGRERPGEDIVHDAYKRWYTQSRTAADAHPRNFIQNPSGQSSRPIAKRAKNNHERPIKGSSDAAQLRSKRSARETVVRPVL
jgi:hypothetical protein